MKRAIFPVRVWERLAGRRLLPCLLVFGFPVLAGLLALPVGFWGLSHMALFYSKEVSYADFLTHPIYAGAYYRPLGYLWSKWFYGLFGLYPAPYHLFTAATMGLFAVVLYRFFLHVAPDKKRTALAAAALTAVSPPVWYVLLLRFDPEVLQDILLYLVLLLFLLLSGKDPRRDRALLVAAAVLSFLGGLSRENLRGFLPAMLAATSVVLWREKRLTRSHLAGAVVCIAAVEGATLIQVLGRTGVPFPKPPLYAGLVSFTLLHNSLQMLVPLSFAGGAMLALAHLKSHRGYAGALLIGAAFTIPPIAMVNFEEMVGFPDPPLLVPFVVLMLAALLAWFFRGTRVRRLFSANILAVWAMVSLASLFVPYARGDASTRTFTPVLPMLIWLLVDCLSELWSRGNSAGGRSLPLERRLLQVTVVLCACAFLYTTAASDANMTYAKHAQAYAETEATRQFGNYDLAGARIYTTDIHFLSPEALALLANASKAEYSNPTSPSFDVSPQPVGLDSDVGKETGRGTLYIYIDKFRPVLPPDSPVRPVLHGDFSYYYRTLDMRGSISGPGEWQSLWFDANATSLERSATENGARLFSATQGFVQVPRFLEQVLPMSRAGVPWLIGYEWNVSIYRVARAF